MIPIKKVQDIIDKHTNLEKELSSGNVDSKVYAKKSKEYSNLGNIISIAKEYINFESDKRDLEQILQDKSKDIEIFSEIRLQNDFGGMWGNRNLVNLRSLSAKGVINDRVKFSVGDIMLKQSKYTLYNYHQDISVLYYHLYLIL